MSTTTHLNLVISVSVRDKIMGLAAMRGQTVSELVEPLLVKELEKLQEITNEN